MDYPNVIYVAVKDDVVQLAKVPGDLTLEDGDEVAFYTKTDVGNFLAGPTIIGGVTSAAPKKRRGRPKGSKNVARQTQE